MKGELARVVGVALEDIISGTAGRLEKRTEFLMGPGELLEEVRRCAVALRSTAGGTPGALVAEALAFGGADPDPHRGYRRALMLLDSLCAETVEVLRGQLAPERARTAIGRLRAILGSAELALVALVKDPSTADRTTERTATGKP